MTELRRPSPVPGTGACCVMEPEATDVEARVRAARRRLSRALHSGQVDDVRRAFDQAEAAQAAVVQDGSGARTW